MCDVTLSKPGSALATDLESYSSVDLDKSSTSTTSNSDVTLTQSRNTLTTNLESDFFTSIEKPCTSGTSSCSVSDTTGELLLETTPLTNQRYKTDRVNFGHQLTINDKRIIVKQGPCQPQGPFPKNKEGRCFSVAYYVHKTKSGIIYNRNWLSYSNALDVAYCEPCWLFSQQGHGISKTKDARINGYNDWRHVSQSIARHEASNSHVTACQIFNKWKLDSGIDSELDKQLQYEINFWGKVLHRIINVTLTLAQNNQAFSGHRESLYKEETNRGNFLNVIKLLPLYDPVLKELLSKEKGSVKYLSPLIQNEIIELLAQNVKTQIINKINSAPFFSIILDTTQDVAKIDQISFIVRFVEIVTSNERAQVEDLVIREVFLGFEKADEQSAENLEKQLLNYFEENQLDIQKLRGQGYDGAANMSGIYNGLQTKIKQRQPKACYVHCAAHNLNLVINDAAKATKEVDNFYDLVESIYVFFGHSINRWAKLIAVFEVKKHLLKKLCPTRWSSRHEALHSLRFHYLEVLQTLTNIILTSNKPNEKNEASSLKKKMETFETVIMIVIQSKILNITNLVSNALQNKNTNIGKAYEILESSYKQMLIVRDNYGSIIDEATKLGKTWGFKPIFENKRKRKVKRYFDELCSDERLENPEDYFRTAVFNMTLDKIIMQLKDRFKGFRSVVQNFKVLFPETLQSSTDEELKNLADNLILEYPEDLSNTFSNEILLFRNAFKDQLNKNIFELAKSAIVDYDTLASSYREVCTAYVLFFTIPVTVATAERSFSKLKIIKNYLRNTMAQDRLSSLAILAIENDTARNLDLSNIISQFANSKARKVKF